MTKKMVTQAYPLGCTLDKTGYIGHNKAVTVTTVNHSKYGMKCRKRIAGDLGLCV